MSQSILNQITLKCLSNKSVMRKHIMKQRKQIHKEELKFYRNRELMMRSIKMYVPTLDKYIKLISHKKEKEIFKPKSREVDIINPE